jgi:excinuclease ABC subunit C
MNSKERKNNLTELKNRCQFLPTGPGVYLMKNSRGQILYIGKAKSLRKRVRSYFSGLKDVKTRHLISKISDIEALSTGSEAEALLLENNLIKHWKPKYNINLKDGKTYPVIKLTNEAYPRLYRTRRIVFDGSKYFGPYPNAAKIDTILHLVDRTFPLRKCRGAVKTRETPCLNYHIGRCSAPCCGLITRDEYLARVDKVVRLLSGKTAGLIRELKEKMHLAAESREYEEAGRYRDQLAAVESLTAEQKVVDFQDEPRDYVGLEIEGAEAQITVLQSRGGKLVGRDLFLLEDYSPAAELLTNFLAQYYGNRENLPRRVYLPALQSLPASAGEPFEVKLVQNLLRSLTGQAIRCTVPIKGRHARLLAMAREHAAKKLEHKHREQEQVLEEARRVLNLPRLPRVIEGIDISHLEGQDTVASLVSFLDGRPRKSEYRRYSLKSLGGRIDDFESIREVMARRYTRLQNEERRKPDLILIDGGKGQVSAALAVLRALELDSIPLIGLAKRNEELFVPGKSDPLLLPETSTTLRLLIAVRDEAHRFATGFQKQLRHKRLGQRELEKVAGVGRVKSRRLLEQFGSLTAIARQTPEEIARVGPLSLRQAQDLLRFLAESPVP